MRAERVAEEVEAFLSGIFRLSITRLDQYRQWATFRYQRLFTSTRLRSGWSFLGAPLALDWRHRDRNPDERAGVRHSG
jgi:hypothetical protein